MSGVNKLQHTSYCFFLTALLACNSQSTQFTHLKYTLQQVFKFTELCNHPHNFRTFSSCPKETPYPLGITTPNPSSLNSSALRNNSSTFCLYRLAYSGHFVLVESHSMPSFVWHPSLSIVILRLIYVVAYIKLPFLLIAEQYSLVWIYQFCLFICQ